eukprot:scaffold98_cov248-Ochromonas_danica.AAC.15
MHDNGWAKEEIGRADCPLTEGIEYDITLHNDTQARLREFSTWDNWTFEKVDLSLVRENCKIANFSHQRQVDFLKSLVIPGRKSLFGGGKRQQGEGQQKQ